MSSKQVPSSAGSEAQLTAPDEPLVLGRSTPESTDVKAQRSPHMQLAASSSEFTMDEAAKQNFLWHVHQYLGEYARFGDSKAGLAGTIAAALLGALYSAEAHIPLVDTAYNRWGMATWFTVVSGVFLIGCILLAMWTVLPRLRSTQSKGFIFWGSIAAHRTVNMLQTSFHAQSARTLNDHLLHQVFDLSSKVCMPKYRSVSLCIWMLVIGGFFGMAALVLQDIPQGTVLP